MKLKLRKLRKKREMLAHWKGGVSKSYNKWTLEKPAIVKRRGKYTRVGDKKPSSHFLIILALNEILSAYYKFKIIPKSKKRGGKNR
ncbi:hypothetical protein IX325_001537 [Fusobacterium necrophorum subsp. funduliforme]|nr:hypothetical protein [Fusobacterium necrophorum subsp. funduliforme]